MRKDDIDRILSEEEEIVPSAGFLSGVMGVVQREAVEPAPIPFPWRRALPGILAAIFVLSFAFVAGLATSRHGISVGSLPFTMPSSFALVLQVAQEIRVGWITLALALSLVAMKLPAVLAMRRMNF